MAQSLHAFQDLLEHWKLNGQYNYIEFIAGEAKDRVSTLGRQVHPVRPLNERLVARVHGRLAGGSWRFTSLASSTSSRRASPPHEQRVRRTFQDPHNL